MCSQDDIDIYQKHNYVHSMESYFNIMGDSVDLNYFLYRNNDGNDLNNLLFDFYRLSKTMISDDIAICLKLVEEDIFNRTVLGIFIKCSLSEAAEKFFLFKDELFERHESGVLDKIFIALMKSMECSNDFNFHENFNYADFLDSYYNINDEDRLAVNIFLYENNENNDLIDLLLDVYRMSKSEISGDVALSLKLNEMDIEYETLLEIYIQMDIDDRDNFRALRDKLYFIHGREVFNKASIFAQYDL